MPARTPRPCATHGAASAALYLQLLAQKGVIVWECDNRSASGKGVESTFAVYQHFGKSEADDIEDCVSWLKKQPYVDATRIGVNGWSFGGFMTSYLLTHSKSFAMASLAARCRTGATTIRSTPNATCACRKAIPTAIAPAPRAGPRRT